MLVAQHGTEHPEVNTVKRGGRGPFNLCPLRFEEPQWFQYLRLRYQPGVLFFPAECSAGPRILDPAGI